MEKLTCALLVDDDQTNNYLNKLLLSRLQVTDKLLVALNGQEALALVEEHCQEATPSCPALILLDVKMPVMNGFEFLEAYAELSLPQKHAIIIVMLTTSLHPQDMERVQKLHVDGFLSKPLTKAKVEGILETYFHRHLPKE
ncbi:response regulator [Hymenobacter sp. BT507]|uniref:Response regulator n=1 Tax=Hymenobacter citatus TaxID=2763506 RepID=A0ABR7MHD2_9BACT|nr:response regulator [Hymenobacter citatus]MBC6610494.1 response regulator [Hymenobacter citatus]